MKHVTLTVKRLADGRYAVMAGREIIDVYKDQATAQAARDNAVYVSYTLRHPKLR